MNTIANVASSVRFCAEYRVYYEDTDAGGVVYHANYLKFMERARSDWLAEHGCLPQQPEDDWGVIFAVHSMSMVFLKPARLGQNLSVSCLLDSIDGASFRISQAICDDNRDILVRAKFRIVCVDSETFRVARIPTELRRRLI